MRAVGIGDLHLTSAVGKGALSKYLGQPDAFVIECVNRVLDEAAEAGILQVFLYGDVCEGTRMSYDAQLALLSVLKRDFEFHIILGNHDMFSEDPSAGHSLQLIKEFGLPNVHIYETVTDVEIEGQQVRFLPWPHANFSKSRLNICHCDVAGAKTDSGREITEGSESNSWVVSGHIHTAQRVRNTFYSGTLYQTDFGESEKKYYHLIEYDGGWDITDVPFKPSVILKTYEVSTKKQLLALPRRKHEWVRLVLKTGFTPAHEDLVGLNIALVKTEGKEQALEELKDVKYADSVTLSVDEFFNYWIEQVTVEQALKERASQYRAQVLKRLNK